MPTIHSNEKYGRCPHCHRGSLALSNGYIICNSCKRPVHIYRHKNVYTSIRTTKYGLCPYCPGGSLAFGSDVFYCRTCNRSVMILGIQRTILNTPNIIGMVIPNFHLDGVYPHKDIIYL